MLGLTPLQWMNRDARFHLEPGGGRTLGALLLGVAFAFGWTPCIGPVLGAILTLGASTADVAKGATLLAVYSLGLGLPFLLAALFTGTLLAWLKALGRAGRNPAARRRRPAGRDGRPDGHRPARAPRLLAARHLPGARHHRLTGSRPPARPPRSRPDPPEPAPGVGVRLQGPQLEKPEQSCGSWVRLVFRAARLRSARGGSSLPGPGAGFEVGIVP